MRRSTTVKYAFSHSIFPDQGEEENNASLGQADSRDVSETGAHTERDIQELGQQQQHEQQQQLLPPPDSTLLHLQSIVTYDEVLGNTEGTSGEDTTGGKMIC